jgi:hypothetical protein
MAGVVWKALQDLLHALGLQRPCGPSQCSFQGSLGLDYKPKGVLQPPAFPQAVSTGEPMGAASDRGNCGMGTPDPTLSWETALWVFHRRQGCPRYHAPGAHSGILLKHPLCWLPSLPYSLVPLIVPPGSLPPKLPVPKSLV